MGTGSRWNRGLATGVARFADGWMVGVGQPSTFVWSVVCRSVTAGTVATGRERLRFSESCFVSAWGDCADELVWRDPEAERTQPFNAARAWLRHALSTTPTIDGRFSLRHVGA